MHHPDWLARRLLNRDDKTSQRRINEIFKPLPEQGNTHNKPPEDIRIADIEDFGNKSTVVSAAGGKRRIGAAFSLSKKKGRSKPPKTVIPSGTEDPFIDYRKWLEQKKGVWRDMLRKRDGAVDGSGIKSFFTSTTRKINEGVWQILQIAETDTAGIFRIWAIIEGVIESILFEVPRILYYNSRTPFLSKNLIEGIQMTKVVRTLPRNRPLLHLYELRMAETFYRKNSKIFASLFNHSDSEGVYESKISPLFRALLQVGCFGTLKRKNHLDTKDCFPLDELVRNTSPLQLKRYLIPETFQLIHLYCAKVGSRQLWGLFVPYAAIVHVFIVDPGVNRGALPQFKRLYAEIYEETFDSALSSVYPETVEFKHIISESETEVIKSLNRIIHDIKDEGNKPIMLGVQAAGGSLYLRSIGLSSIREFPVLPISIRSAYL